MMEKASPEDSQKKFLTHKRMSIHIKLFFAYHFREFSWFVFFPNGMDKRVSKPEDKVSMFIGEKRKAASNEV